MNIKKIDEEDIYSMEIFDNELETITKIIDEMSFNKLELFDSGTSLSLIYNILLRYVCTQIDDKDLFKEESSKITCYLKYQGKVFCSIIYKIYTNEGYEYSYCLVEDKIKPSV